MDWSLPAFLVLGVLGVQLARIDIAHHLLPNPLVLALLIGRPGALRGQQRGHGRLGRPAPRSRRRRHLFVVYLILAIISPSGIGMGDVKLAAPVGLYLGYLGWSQLFYGGALGLRCWAVFSPSF